jgi:hypothetical protein
MAALHATTEKDNSDRGKHSTTAHREIRTEVQTWNGAISILVRKDDSFEITVGPHTSESRSRRVLATGRLAGFEATIQLQGEQT